MLPLSDIQCFALFFPFCLFTILFIYGQTAVNEVALMAAILVQKCFFFIFEKKKKISPGDKESLFALNHLIYIFSIYIYM